MISLNEIRAEPERWANTSKIRSDGKTEYREKKEYGNRHVVFDIDAFWGTVHIDQYNATDVPVGTVKHFSNYVEEKTSIPQGLVTLAAVGVGLFVCYKAVKWAEKNL